MEHIHNRYRDPVSEATHYTFREYIQVFIARKLAVIHPDNGFMNDLTGKGQILQDVYDIPLDLDDPIGKVAFIEKDEHKEIVFGDDNTNFVSTTHTAFDMLFFGAVIADLKNQTKNAQILMTDVKRALALITHNKSDGQYVLDIDPKYGVLNNIRLEAGVVRPPEEGSNYCFFQLEARLDVFEEHITPYIPKQP